MRHHIMTAAVLLASGPAFASSIEPIATSSGTGNSIMVRSCTDCPVLQVAKDKIDYIVPALKAGTQNVEIRDVNGEKKIVRTEAWLGGSPVVFISKAPADTMGVLAQTPGAKIRTEPSIVEAMNAEPVPSSDGIDRTATTAAVEPVGASLSGPVEETVIQPLKTDDFELRLK